MRDAGITYDDAARIYDCMVSAIEDAVVNGEVVRFGRVGAIVPVVRPPREVQMGFKLGKGRKVSLVRRIFNLDSRLVFKFRLYRKFTDTRTLHWFGS